MSNSLTLLLTGRSGCGKGTQANLLIEYLKKNDAREILYVYAGDKMRELVAKKENLTSKLAEEIMMSGKKQPDFLAIWSWSNELVDKLTDDAHLIIDGSPRTAIEAKVLDEAFEFYGRKNIKPILVDVSYKWASARLLARKRFDDTEERIKNRLEYFEKFVEPAIDYYEKESKNKLIRVNGEQTIEEVHKEIIEKLEL